MADMTETIWSEFVAQCESLEEEAARRLSAGGLSEQETGFWRGQARAAKSIRRSVAHPKYRGT